MTTDRDLGRLEGKVDMLLELANRQVTACDCKMAKFDTRITAVERKVWRWGGGAALLAFIVASWSHITTILSTLASGPPQ